MIRKIWIMALLCIALFACSDGELEGDLYPVATNKGGGSTGKDSNMEAVVKRIKENMIAVYGGSFQMGATPKQQYNDDALSNEYPAHEVSVDRYRLCRYEMTQKEWNTIAAWGGYQTVDFSEKGDDLPVTGVTYDMCQDIINILNRYTGLKFRLPTEAEWEYAARDYGSREDYKYAGGNSLYQLAWYDDNSRGYVHPVGKKEPNGRGFYDMSGNVAEWCSDLYKEDYNPGSKIYQGYRVIRGGSYDMGESQCRVSWRMGMQGSEACMDLGLRLAANKFYDIRLSSEYEEFGIEGGVHQIEIMSNIEMLQFRCEKSWCKVSKSGDKLIISVDKNEGIQREVEILIWSGDENWEGETTITIVQNGKKRAQVGDLYSQNNIDGIVWQVSEDGRSGKIVSLREASYIWSSLYSSSYGYTGATSLSDGEANMQTIRNLSYSFSSWPAFEWCYYYSYDWYLPATDELVEMFAAVRRFGASRFDRILAENGGNEFSSSSDYWSSTEYDYEWAYSVNKSGTVKSNVGKNNTFRVRAVRKVTFE